MADIYYLNPLKLCLAHKLQHHPASLQLPRSLIDFSSSTTVVDFLLCSHGSLTDSNDGLLCLGLSQFKYLSKFLMVPR